MIQIPAVLETRRYLRLFDHWNRDADTALRDSPLPDHDQVIALIQKRTRRGDYMPNGILSSRIFSGTPVVAYQIVEATTISDQRSEFGHNDLSIEKTSALLSKKVYILGKMITRAKAKSLVEWIKKQRNEEGGDRWWRTTGQVMNDILWKRMGLSNMSGRALHEFLRQRRFTHAIKIGHDTIVPFDPKLMEFRPMKE